MHSVTEIAQSVRSGKASALDYVEACLRQIDARDAGVKAWVHVDRDGARKLAGQRLSGPLAGVPVGMKDIFDVAGMPTQLGAGPWALSHPSVDSEVAARLRAAGAIILGKTTTTPFAYSDPSPAHNPWDLEHTPGGSSSGSAAAVAAGMAPLAFGSQTVGSTLRPAAYCGIVGLKPSHGRISAAGVWPLAYRFDHPGIFTRSVRDAALALSVVAGYDSADPYSEQRPVDDYLGALEGDLPAPRIGLARSFYQGVANEEVASHLDAIAERFAAAGANVVETEMPATAQEIFELGQPIMQAEAAVGHKDLFPPNHDVYPPLARTLVENGRKLPAVAYIEALQARHRLRQSLIERLSGFDAILLPVALSTAPLGFTSTGSPWFCAPASFAGLPSIALPSGLGDGGLPLSVQLMAGPFAEADLVRTAAWAERTLDFHAHPAMASGA